MTSTGRPGLDSPIFIGGLSNSGKTPVRRILESHPDLWFSRRTYIWPRFHGRFGDLEVSENLDRLIEAVMADPGGRALEPDPRALRAEFEGGAPSYTRLFWLLHSQHARRLGARRWGVQVKAIERFAGAIFSDLPAARMLHLIRDPFTRSAGIGAGRWGWESAKWSRSAETSLRNQSSYSDGYRVVRFEHLAADPIGEIEGICRFIDEDVDPAMVAVMDGVDFTQVRRDVQTRPIPRHARGPMGRLGYADRSGTEAGRRRNMGGAVSTWAGSMAWRVVEGTRHISGAGGDLS